MKKDKIKIGVIGVGHLGAYHAQKYDSHPGVELAGVVDTNRDRAEEIARRHSTNAYFTPDDILSKVDAVSLAVPTEMHYNVAKNILSKGVHLLIEKPITYQLEQADTLINMAREKNLVLQVGLIERFNPAVVKMEEYLSNPVYIESHRMNPFTPRGTDVDVVLDLMIHDLDIILHSVKSEVKELYALGMTLVTGKIDISNVRMIFENGTVANLTASRVSDNTTRQIRIFQDDTCLNVDCFRREFCVTSLNGAPSDNEFPEITCSKMEFTDSDPLSDEIYSFVDSVINDKEPVVSGLDGKRALQYALQIIDQIDMACKNKVTLC